MLVPSKISLNKEKNCLSVYFETNGMTECYELSSEYLRVCSSSAEVIGHGPGQETLQLNKQDVTITEITPQGNYAILLVFSDGHNSGIYSWETLYGLGVNYEKNWVGYLEACREHMEDQAAAEQATSEQQPQTTDSKQYSELH